MSTAVDPLDGHQHRRNRARGPGPRPRRRNSSGEGHGGGGMPGGERRAVRPVGDIAVRNPLRRRPAPLDQLLGDPVRQQLGHRHGQNPAGRGPAAPPAALHGHSEGGGPPQFRVFGRFLDRGQQAAHRRRVPGRQPPGHLVIAALQPRQHPHRPPSPPSQVPDRGSLHPAPVFLTPRPVSRGATYGSSSSGCPPAIARRRTSPASNSRPCAFPLPPHPCPPPPNAPGPLSPPFQGRRPASEPLAQPWGGGPSIAG